MAKQNKPLPARKPRDRSRDDDDSLLLRSAESLGRVIGALQRQLDGATRRLSQSNGNGAVSAPKTRARKTTTRRAKTAAPLMPKAAPRRSPGNVVRSGKKR
jgi:hypothetical protein